MVAVGTGVRGHRDFRLFWLGGAATLLGSHASALVLPVLVLLLGGSPVTAGVLGTAVGLAEVLISPAAGVCADRVPRRPMMVVSALVAACAAGAIALVVLTGRVSLPVLFAAAVVEGAATACYAAAASGAIRAILPPDDPAGALGALQAREKAAKLAGPGVGGGLYQLAPWAPFLVHAACHAVAALCARALGSDLRPARVETTRPAFARDFADGVRFLWAEPFLRFMTVWAAGVNLVLGALYFHVILVARLHGASAATIGLMLTAAGVAGLCGALFAPTLLRRFPPIRLVLVVSWSMALVAFAFTASPPPAVMGVLLATVSALTPALSIAFQSKAITRTPDGMQGRVGTALRTLGEGTGAVAPLAAGALVATLAPALVAAVLGLGLTAIALHTTAVLPSLTAAPDPDRVPDQAGE
ncbi:putative MFS family arabinose efflux permease [Actinokineospora spheciospongiae]|nr:putative MFS family arabinose efflux permease [Actinokineospora spheciospongiae]